MERWQMIAAAVVLGLLLVDGLLWRAVRRLEIRVRYDEGDYADETASGL